jgi:archaeal flagellar protein FlaJ
MKFKKEYLIGIGFGLVLVAFDYFYLFETRWFYAAIVLSIGIGLIQVWFDLLRENQRDKEVEEKFLEWVRALVGTVKSGISIPAAVVQVSRKDYGALNPYTIKLANQIEWGIPVRKALLTFSNDTNNKVIKRAVSIVMEAEKSGGDIENVLVSVTNSVVNVKKMKAERKSSAYSQIVQGYIVFFIFIGIMLLMQIKLFPLLEGMSGGLGGALSSVGFGGGAIGGAEQTVDLDKIFFMLTMIQGLFAGIMVGKFSEGSLKQGLLHSAILMMSAALLITTIKGGI